MIADPIDVAADLARDLVLIAVDEMERHPRRLGDAVADLALAANKMADAYGQTALRSEEGEDEATCEVFATIADALGRLALLVEEMPT